MIPLPAGPTSSSITDRTGIPVRFFRLSSTMNHYLTEIEFGDPCSLGLLSFLLIFIGSHMIDGKPLARAWGWRLAATVFVAFAAHQLLRHRLPDARTLVAVSFRSLLAASIGLGLAWILLGILAFFHDALVLRPMATLRQRIARAKTDWAARRARAAQEREREREQREVERQGPEREAATRAAAENRQRYDEVLQECEFLYVQSAPELGSRMPRELFDSLVNKYLQPDLPADLLRARAKKLQDLLRKHLEVAKPAPKFTSLADILKWFEEKQREIQSGPGDDKQKQTYLVQLKIRYADLVKAFIEET